MASVFRLSTQLSKQLLNNSTKKYGMLGAIRPVTLKAQPSTSIITGESHDDRNARLNRPQSPHLTIYAFQLTSVLSISHRFTGIALASYASALGLGAVVLPETIPHYLEALQAAKIGSLPIISLKFMLAFPFMYHFWNGIRHLFWDTGKFLTIKQVYLTGYIMLGITVVSTLIAVNA